MLIVLFLLIPSIDATSTSIPWIRNVSLISAYPINSTMIFNVTCYQCLCENLGFNAMVINCFEFNQSCQFFTSFPRTYRLESISQTRLYFPQSIFPPPSQCCAPNLTELINKLANSVVRSVNVTSPRCLVVDNNNYLVTVQDGGTLVSRFNLISLGVIDQTHISGAAMRSITYLQQAYYIGRNDQSVLVLNSKNLTILNVITSPSNINGIRDLMFLMNGQMLVLASPDNSRLVFFNRSTSSPYHYSYMYHLSTVGLCEWPHGLQAVNDSFFYLVTWDGDSIFSYSTSDHVTWSVRLVINATVMTNGIGRTGTGSHLTIDECDRRWFSIYNFGLFIYDLQGTFLTNFTSVGRGLFDIIFLDNYVMYVSDLIGGRIFRFDPGIVC